MKIYLNSNKAKISYFIIYTVFGLWCCVFFIRLIQSADVEKCVYKINSKMVMFASATLFWSKRYNNKRITLSPQNTSIFLFRLLLFVYCQVEKKKLTLVPKLLFGQCC